MGMICRDHMQLVLCTNAQPINTGTHVILR